MKSLHFYTVRGVMETEGGCVDIAVEHIIAENRTEAANIAKKVVPMIVTSTEIWKADKS